MESRLLLFVSVLLVSTWGGQASSPTEYCHGNPCPGYRVEHEEKDCEDRLYDASEWISTIIKGTSTTAGLKAYKTLKKYCEIQRAAGLTICDDTWPVLITFSRYSQQYNLSWFIHPNATKPATTDQLVNIIAMGPARFYVKRFDGFPTLLMGQTNIADFQKTLRSSGKHFDDRIWFWASYDPLFFTSTHHNEALIPVI